MALAVEPFQAALLLCAGGGAAAGGDAEPFYGVYSPCRGTKSGEVEAHSPRPRGA